MWSDNETDIDLLHFKYLAATATGIVKTPRLLPTTIGVFGDWGSGKSSLLKMIQADFSEDKTVMCLSFNGWLFEGYEDAKTALMGTILDAIQDQATASQPLPEKALTLLDKLRKRIHWFQLASLTGRFVLPSLLSHHHPTWTGAGTAVATGVYQALQEKKKDERLTVEDVEKLLNSAPEGAENIRRNIRDFHKDFAELLKETKISTLVVFIDDLDRCLPDTIIETLEAIKLFLFVPGSVFILGADERLIQYAVRQRFPELPGTEAEVGRDYLEKLIQIPLRIPPLSGPEVHSYINLLFAQLRLSEPDYKRVCAYVAGTPSGNVADLSFDIEVARELCIEDASLADLASDLDFAAQVAPILIPGLLGNPRRTKRFLNTLLLRLTLGTARGLTLQRQILAKLMLLEYIKPEFFKQLAAIQADQGGRPEELRELETNFRARPPETEAPAKAASAKGGSKEKKGEQEPASSEIDGPGTAFGHKEAREFAAEIQPWLADPWMCSWLASDPRLADTDLRPYFYIAHDRIGVLDGTQLRLTPAATEALNKLLSNQPVTQTLGLNAVASLNTSDATAVFQALAQRIRQAEALDNRSPHAVLFKLMGHRPELLPQLIALYGSLPEPKITLATPAQLYEIANGTPSAQAARSLLDRWVRSTAPGLSTAAKQALNREWKVM